MPAERHAAGRHGVLKAFSESAGSRPTRTLIGRPQPFLGRAISVHEGSYLLHSISAHCDGPLKTHTDLQREDHSQWQGPHRIFVTLRAQQCHGARLPQEKLEAVPTRRLHRRCKRTHSRNATRERVLAA